MATLTTTAAAIAVSPPPEDDLSLTDLAAGACCCGCGKLATGVLMGRRNDDRGPYTAKCAEKAIAAARKAEAKAQAGR